MPENQLAFAVGVMLTSFGIFWAGEGAGVDWPEGEAALAILVLATATWALAFAAILRQRHGRLGASAA